MKMTKPASTGPRQEPIGLVALCLAIVLMVLPSERDVLWILHRSGMVQAERCLWIGSFVTVLTLLIVSLQRVRRKPERWRGKPAHVITACVLMLNVVNALVALHYHAL